MSLAAIEYDQLYEYAAFRRYPTGSSKNQHRIIRRKCLEHFRAENKQGVAVGQRQPRQEMEDSGAVRGGKKKDHGILPFQSSW